MKAKLLLCVLMLGMGVLMSLGQSPNAAAVAPAPAVVEPVAPAVTLVVQRRACSGTWYSAVAGYTDWAKSKADCAHIGSSGLGYAWSIPPGSNGRICVEGKGHFWNSEKQELGFVWKSLGCGTSGSGSVPWKGKDGNDIAAIPMVRAMVQPGFIGGAYKWRF